jgi:hypothetical protein
MAVIPKWKKITKKRYIKLKDDLIYNVKAVPIFEKGSGIIKQIKGEAKIIKYEYYKQIGLEVIQFVSKGFLDKLNELQRNG